jgi:hypothetical protein
MLCLPYAAVAAEADAEENTGLNYFTGEIGVDVSAGNTSGSDAKANEYGPRDGGMGVGVDLEWVKNQYQFKMDGEFNGGIHDSDGRQGYQQYDYDFNASFKKLDSYKVDVFAQRIIHNMSEGRRIGDPESENWGNTVGGLTDFTFNKARTNAGIGLEAAFGTPFFASVKMETKMTEGITPLFTNGGISTAPLDTTVNMISGEFGYRADNLIIKLDGSIDQLRNGHEMLSDNGLNDHYVKRLNPESENYKIGGSLSWRIPSIKSSLLARASFSNMTSDWMSTGSYYSSVPGSTGGNGWFDYKGDIKNTVVNVAFTSRPIKGLSTKVYVNYFDRQNDSEVDYRNETMTPANRGHNDLAFYEFERLTAGVEAGYRFGGDYKISGGYEYEGVDRNAYDVTEVSKTDDNRVWAKFDAQLTDTFAVNFGYQFLNRDSAETEALFNTGTPSSWAIAPWFSYADTASKRQHEFTAGVEFTPAEKLYLGLEYSFTYDDFTKKQEFGKDDGYTHGLIADISYDFGPAQIALYGGVDYTTSETNQRGFDDSGANADPGSGNTSASVTNWDFEQKDITWSFGLNGNIDLIEDTLALQLRYDFIKNDGKTELSSAFGPLVRGDIDMVDDYTEHLLSAMLKYKMDEHHSFGFGYTFSYLDYEDYAYDDAGATHTSTTNSGYNHGGSYETHTVGLTYKYSF